MKHIFIILMLLTVTSKAQNRTKDDIILQLNGEELNGKVTEITDDAVKFMYSGETLTYTIKKADILKITYASGRIEVYNKPQLSTSSQKVGSASAPTGSLSDHHNKVAILPFQFVKDGQKAADEMSNIVQLACLNYLSKHAGVLSIVDTRTTNAKLIKAGVTRENMEGYTMDDICNILDVEFVVDGTVMQNKAAETTLANNYYSGQNKGNRNDQKSSGYSSANTTNYQSYETTISLEIYNDKGNNMFSRSRKAFFKTQDAYQNALEYVLKRSPLYSK